MTNKNSPLRVIDQKTVNKTPPPGAKPVRYNPYTGGVIRQSTEPRNKIFLQTSTNWVKTPLNLYKESDLSRGIIEFAVRVPKLVIRMENPNADIYKLRIFLSFEADTFDRYDDEDFNDMNDRFSNIVSFVTGIVTHVGPNNRGVGNLDITSHIVRLFNKYNFYQLLLASGVDITIEEFRTKSNDELKDIFENSMYNMRVYAQAMYQELEPDDTTTSAPFLFRVPVSCSYTLSPDQLRNADVSDFTVSFSNDQFILNFTQTSIDWIEITIYDISTTAVLNSSNQVYRRRLNSFPDKRVSARINVSELSNRFNKFNDFSSALTNTTSLLQYNSKYRVEISTVRTLAGVIFPKDKIKPNFLVEVDYDVSIPVYSDGLTTERRHVLNLIDGFREYTYRKENLAPIGGVLLIYKVLISSATRYIPRFFPVTSLNQTQSGSSYWYFIKDPFKATNLGNSFKLDVTNVQSLDLYLVAPNGRVSKNRYEYNFNKINLIQKLETTFGTPILNGYYYDRFNRSNSFLRASSLVAGNYLAANGRFQLTVRFSISVEINTNGNWVNITPNNTRSRSYDLRMISTHNSLLLSWTLTGSSVPVIFADVGVKFVKGTRYRIRLVPSIPKEYASQYTNGSYIYTMEFIG
jgi:hypothetical protein